MNKKKIFLLDDNPSSFEDSIRILQREYDVEKCRDISSAIRRIGLHQYSVLIIDLMMPTRGLSVKDGFKAGFNFYTEHVKTRGIDTPVVFWTNLTKSSFNEFIARQSNPSNFYYLQKNNEQESLLNLIKSITN